MIRDWYAQGGIDSVNWANDEIKAMFKPDTNKTADPTNENPNTTGSGKGFSSNNANTASDDKFNHTGAVVGAALGGVVGVALITTAAVLLLRRRARRRWAPQRQRNTWFKAELPTEGVKQQNLDRVCVSEVGSMPTAV